MGEGHRKEQRDVVPVLSAAMAGQLELEPVAAPATVFESESMGRERRVRGFHFGDFGHGKRKLAPAAATAMASTSCSSWGAF